MTWWVRVFLGSSLLHSWVAQCQAARAEERLAEPSLPDLSTPISKDPQTTLGPNNCSHLPHRSMPSLTENGNFIDTIGSVRELPDSTESLSPQDLEKDRLHPSFRDEHGCNMFFIKLFVENTFFYFLPHI